MMLFSLARDAVSYATRKLLNRFFSLIDTPMVVILLYHRVTSLPSDPQLLAVSPENFHAQMKYLKDRYSLVRFEEDWSRIEKPSIAITFDDGYADNVSEALPILEEVGVPATFFVSSGNLGTEREYWWDELQRLILADRPLPDKFTLLDHRFGRSWPTVTPAGRIGLYRKLHFLMLQIDPERREDWLTQLRRWSQVDERGRREQRAMTGSELCRLAKSKWVTIGAHTVTHTPLSILSEERQQDEILSSKHQLENLLGMPITVFSYPFGRKRDYNSTTIRICREAGFVKAASNFPGQVYRWTDSYQLPRQLIRNWDVKHFAAKMKGFWSR